MILPCPTIVNSYLQFLLIIKLMIQDKFDCVFVVFIKASDPIDEFCRIIIHGFVIFARYSGGYPLKTPVIPQICSWSRSLLHIAFPEYLVPFLYYNEKFHYQVIGIFEIPITWTINNITLLHIIYHHSHTRLSLNTCVKASL